MGLPDPRDHSSLPMLQAGIARARLLKGESKKIRLPIMAPILTKIRDDALSSSHPKKMVIWAIACTAFFGFFWLGELHPESVRSFNPSTDLAWGDVAVDSHDAPRIMQIHLKKSKCDQFGIGSDILVGATGSDLCPITAILSYIDVQGNQPGAFFPNSSHRPVTKPWFVGEIRRILGSIGLPQHEYARHSFRIGAAIAAAMEDSVIQTLSRWHSAAFLRYIHTPKEHLASLTAILVKPSGVDSQSPKHWLAPRCQQITCYVHSLPFKVCQVLYLIIHQLFNEQVTLLYMRVQVRVD